MTKTMRTMQSITRLLPVAVLSISLVGCASLFKPKQCHPEVAEQMGFEDGYQGKSGKPRANDGGKCEKDYSPTLFKKDYTNGFFRGLKDLCTEAKAKAIATEDLAVSEPRSASRFDACDQAEASPKALAKAYHKAFEDGFCNDDAAAKLGEAQAKDLQAPDLSRFDKQCSAAKKTSLLRAHRAAYAQGLQTRCSALDLQAKGMADARTQPDVSAELARLGRCPKELQASAAAAYTKGFNDSKVLILQERQVALQEENAKKEREIREREMKLREDSLKASIATNTANAAPSASSTTTYLKGQEFLLQCEVHDNKSEARVTAKNLGRDPVTTGGRWIVDLFDTSGKLLDRTQRVSTFSLGPNSSTQETIYFRHYDLLKQCTARFEL